MSFRYLGKTDGRDDTQRVTPQDDRDYEETLRVERCGWVLLWACREAWRFLNEEPTARTLQERMRVNAILRNALSRATGGQEP